MDVCKKTLFSAVVKLNGCSSSYADSEETFDVELDKPIEELTYDEVEEAVCNAVVKKHRFSESDFDDDVPYEIIDIVVNDGGECWPVVSEDADVKSLGLEPGTRVLVLPWGRYSLTPECKLWMSLKDRGMISDDEQFDFEEMHELVNAAK